MSPTIPSLQARWRVWRWILWLGLGAVGVSWAWQTVMREQAADEVRAAGFILEENKIWEVARKDWHGLFEWESWRADRCVQYIGRDGGASLRNLDTLGPAFRRLHLVGLNMDRTDLEDLDALRQLSTLRLLVLVDCPALQNVDGLQGLTHLECLYIERCPALQNVDSLKGLTTLKRVQLKYCHRLTAQSITDLKAALPQAAILYRP